MSPRLRAVPVLAAVLMAAFLSACPTEKPVTPPPDASVSCTPGDPGCTCLTGDACDVAAKCVSGKCQACATSLGCTCGKPEDCASTEVCVDRVCKACAPGAEGCACKTGDACDTGLECQQKVCVKPSCTPGETGCACQGGGCASGGVCDAATAKCRAALDCAGIGCPEHRKCETAAGADARCLEECEAGYSWDAPTRGCVKASCANLDCTAKNMLCVDGTAGPKCEGCRPGFVAAAAGGCAADPAATCAGIEAQCTALHRACAETAGAGASCADCLDGYGVHPLNGECAAKVACQSLDCATKSRECVSSDFSYCGGCLPFFVEEAGACRPVVKGATLTCQADEYVVPETPTSDARCAKRPCPDGQAAMPDGSCENASFPCPSACTGEGQSGKIWPFRVSTGLSAGVCFCETTDGYFYDLDTRTAVACDADHDGWVKVSARAALLSTDAAVKANARCVPKTIDRFELVNELGQSVEIVRCATEPALRGPGDPVCLDPAPAELYENGLQDDDALLAGSQGPGPYGGGTGMFKAKELNSLTKACSSRTADYNGNAVADLTEHAASEFPFTNPNKIAALSPFLPFATFLELHRVRFVANPAGSVGKVRIEERSRCAGEVPVAYGSTKTYWRECTRNRDARFDGTAGDGSQIGLDLARFACDQDKGTCPAPAPVVDSLPFPASAGEDLGLCDPMAPVPADWRGMMHHSQYQCVVAVATPVSPDPKTPYRYNVSQFVDENGANGGILQLNTCQASSPTTTPSGQGDIPQVTCSAANGKLVAQEQVGLAAVTFNPYANRGSYQRGCLDECLHYGSVCDGMSGTPPTGSCFGAPDDFGAIVCQHCPKSGQFCQSADPNTFGPCSVGTYQCINDTDTCVVGTPEPEKSGNGIDENCDGLIDLELTGYVYLSTKGNAANDGLTPATAVPSLGQALQIATSGTTARRKVLVEAGEYLVSAPGFALEASAPFNYRGPYTVTGGFTSDCAGLPEGVGRVRWCDKKATVLVKSDGKVSQSASTRGAWASSALSGAIAITGIDFQALAGSTTGKSGASSYGLLLTDTGPSKVTFERCRFTAGDGNSGDKGTAHAGAALPGGDGAPGMMGGRYSCGAAYDDNYWTLAVGGLGGKSPGAVGTCEGGPGGSAGGNLGGNICAASWTYATGGNAGTSAGVGSVGQGGPKVPLKTNLDHCASLGQISQYDNQTNYVGGDATPVAPAVSSPPAKLGDDGSLRVCASGQPPTLISEAAPGGGQGTKGACGAGGGGGGGGDGDNVSTYWANGSSGGGGGGGGAGGLGGWGGANGGGSYGAFLSNCTVEFKKCSFVANTGGNGGLGSAGQTGGSGGKGGAGGECNMTRSMQEHASRGAAGGRGADGQQGSDGGAGAGGPSVGIVKYNETTVSLVTDVETTFAAGTAGQNPRTKVDGLSADEATETDFSCP